MVTPGLHRIRKSKLKGERMYDYAIIGGGIIGLATAASLAESFPRSRILLLEKEDRFAEHQTGRNSGVIHAGIYYKPGSLKARLAQAGNLSMRKFCDQRGIPYEICGKIIVATEESELLPLERLFQRGVENGIPVAKFRREQVREYEPYVSCLAGIRVFSTGITNYRAVCQALIDDLHTMGVNLRVGTEMLSSVPTSYGHLLKTTSGEFAIRFLIVCAGLHSDRVSMLMGIRPQVRIVPFRGEYYELVPERRHLVRGLVYPVANPNFPFLGVHFTRMIDGSVHAGPNAVLALKREGYSKLSFSPKDTMETLSYPGFWKLASQYYREGFSEIFRSLSKKLFTRSLQRLIPEVTADDLIPSEPGVRAQALAPDGSLVDDFLIQKGKNSLLVLNAPSPAATASLEIAKYITTQVPQLSRSTFAVRVRM
jgi:(S)-2-hydroxyglutarate dehydrogenase